jgi:hypothetical protein
MFNFLTDSISVAYNGGFDQNQSALPHWGVFFGSGYVLVYED